MGEIQCENLEPFGEQKYAFSCFVFITRGVAGLSHPTHSFSTAENNLGLSKKEQGWFLQLFTIGTFLRACQASLCCIPACSD